MRDSQKSKVYKAERAVFENGINHSKQYDSWTDLMDFADKVIRRLWQKTILN